MSQKTHFGDDGFRLRGVELARIDAFSDVVFGFALTMLVVSLEVPKTYAELHHAILGFVPFAICFLFLMMVWHSHYKYFRRFGTHDFRTILINSILLFVVLFFVYPLKFLFTFLTSGMMGHWEGFFESQHELTELMILYGLGFAAVYCLVGALYWNAYRQRDELELTPRERVLTRSYIAENFVVGSVGLISCLLSWLLGDMHAGYAGFAFWLVAILRPITQRLMRRPLRNLPAPTTHPEPV